MRGTVTKIHRDERADATINVRIPQSLKEGGEAVLEREGISVSEAIRRFYVFLEHRQKIPDCIRDKGTSSSSDLIAQKRALLKGLAGIAPTSLSLEQIRDERLERHLRAGIQ
jgi:DNA-damage-inducible protein J